MNVTTLTTVCNIIPSGSRDGVGDEEVLVDGATSIIIVCRLMGHDSITREGGKPNGRKEG